jgi:hypothetical protein
MKIALVKQDVYQDLYVQRRDASPEELLFSSIMRVGPIGLFTLFGADFLIVKEADAPECRLWEKVIPHYPPAWFRELKTTPFAKTSFPEAKFLAPGSDRSHADFSVDCAAVDWSAYDVVISINFSIPKETIKRHPNVLWCHMVGEANVLCDHAYHDYDVCLNQETRGIVTGGLGVIDFPYSFVGPDCLSQLAARVLKRPSVKRGIFIEINSFTERPVRDPGHLSGLTSTGQPIRLHQQGIRANLTELYDSKYFVKIGGRKIRGNSVIEAISSGPLVLMNPAELHHSQLLPKECWIYTIEDACKRISELEASPSEYARLVTLQRQLLRSYVVEMPMESLANAIKWKRTKGPTPPPPAPPYVHPLRQLARRFRNALRALAGTSS